jgi:putative hydrolase of the HAD superfamily
LPAPQPESPIRVLLIDAGGVLVDPHPERAVARLAARSGRSVNELEAALLGVTKRGFDRGKLDGAAFAAELGRASGLTLAEQEWRDLWCGIFDDLPLMQDLVEQLSRQHPCYLLTNIDPWHLEHLRARLPLLSRFRGVHASCEVGFAKPDPSYYRLAFERFGLAPEECVLIDDRVESVEAVTRLGARGIVHRGAEATREALAQLGIAGTA